MKRFRFHFRNGRARDGFNLVEATLSLGLMSFAVLTLVPLLGLGLRNSHQAKDDRMAGQIAQTLGEEAKQGTLTAGTTYQDMEGNACTASQAVYTTQSTLAPVTGNASLTRLTLLVTPIGAPDRTRTYVVVFPPPS